MHPSSSQEPGGSPPATPEIVGAIPARFGSTRLPGKVLLPICGRPMIQHVYERATQAEALSTVVVLTDDERVAETVAAFGGRVQMTPATCRSGTDRIAHAAADWTAAVVINIQGDEPLIDPAAISRLARHLAKHPEQPMATLASPAAAGDRENPNVVKVVVDGSGRALYFSRAAIPHHRDRDSTAPSRRHIGIYGYQRAALLELATLPPTALERAESLEQLRALEHGISIQVLEVESAWPGVDTMDDLEAVERLLAR